MPITIPSVLDPKTPNSERRVFDVLRALPDANNWIVLHSLGLSSAYSGEYGELDFVILIPGKGIVCIEVKGGGVSCQAGAWSAIDQHGARHPLKRSPFAQVKEGMWKLVNAIRAHFGDNSIEADTAIGWIVVFPDCESPPATPEFSRTEVLDRTDVEGKWKVRLEQAPSLLAAYGKNKKAPNPSTCSRLLKFMRPTFDRVCTLSSDLWSIEQQIRSLTEEQYAVLDGISDNNACLVHGSAGTGKTLLALEAARRASAGGNAVLLTCFNRNLGQWLSRAVDHVQEKAPVAGNLHKLLRDRILRSTLANDFLRLESAPPPNFFSRDYYELGALAIAESGERFATIIIDEAQDFPVHGLQEIVAQWSAGQNDHRVLLFGDFAKQAIYDSSTKMREDVIGGFPGIATYSLTLNCRNTRLIARQIELVAGRCGARVSDRQPEGHTVEYFYHADDAELLAHLEQVGTALRRQGYKPSDIALLSPSRFETGALSRVTRVGGWPVADLESAKPYEVTRCTIHAFKGLERAVVILADVDTKEANEADSLLYVGMSRARARLFLLCSRSTQQLIDQRIVSNLGLSAVKP